MLGILKKGTKKVGLPPGTLVHIGEKKTEKIRIRLMDYDEHNLEEREIDRIEDCFAFKESPSITWINIDGLHDTGIIERIGERFDLHPLVLEDIVHTDQRPKVEDFENYLFIILKMLFTDEGSSTINTEQFSLILRSNLVITFQEREGDVFDPIRERLRKGKGRIRRMGSDYLAYALMDAIVDNYFIVLEMLGEQIESLEAELMKDPDQNTMRTIHNLKRELIMLRRSVWPLREVINRLERDETYLIQEKTTVFLRDVYDHTIHIIDSIETFRDMVSGMLDLYLSIISNRMNEVMKLLTLIATIFIPLTFIAGIYGMNFKHMPELDWNWGYPAVLVLMLAIGIIMVLWFKRKRFL